MRKILTAFALLAALGLVVACSSGTAPSQGGNKVYTAPSQGSSGGAGGAPSCGGAGKA